MAMVNRVKKVLWDIGFPFRVGFHNSGVNKQDGYIASLISFNVLMSFGAAATFGRLFASNQSEHMEKSTVKILFSLYLIIGITVLLMLNFSKTVQGMISDKFISNGSETETSSGILSKQRILKYLPFVGLIVFIFGVLVIDLLQIMSYVRCTNVYKEHTEAYREACATIFLHLIRPIFCILIVVLAFTYPRDRVFFYRSTKVRYVFAVVVAGLLWVWLDSELHHASELYEGEIRDWSQTGVNCTNVEHGSFNDQCNCKYTYMFRVLRNAGRYIYPLNIEFCLLAAELLLHFFFTVKEKTAAQYARRQEQTISALVIERPKQNGNVFALTCIHKSNRLPQVHDDGSLPLDQPQEENNDSSNVSNQSQESGVEVAGQVINEQCETDVDTAAIFPTENNPKTQPRFRLLGTIRKWIVFGLSVTICLVYLLFSAWVSENFTDDNVTNMKKAYLGFKVAYFILTIAILVFGFWCSKSLIYKHRGYNSFEMLMLACTFGIFFNKFLAIIAAVSIAKGADLNSEATVSEEELDYILDHEKLAGYEIVANLFNIIEVYLQTSLIFHALSIANSRTTKEQKTKHNTFRQVLLFLIPLNATFWIVDSFTIINLKRLDSLSSAYFSAVNYKLVSHLVYPFSLFYRFNSCLTCIKIYLDI